MGHGPWPFASTAQCDAYGAASSFCISLHTTRTLARVIHAWDPVLITVGPNRQASQPGERRTSADRGPAAYWLPCLGPPTSARAHDYTTQFTAPGMILAGGGDCVAPLMMHASTAVAWACNPVKKTWPMVHAVGLPVCRALQVLSVAGK